MQFHKGLAAVSGTVLALLVATIVFGFMEIRAYAANNPRGVQVGYDIKTFCLDAVLTRLLAGGTGFARSVGLGLSALGLQPLTV
jgi:hypothetical protein